MKITDIGIKSSGFHSMLSSEEKEIVPSESISFKNHMTNINRNNCQELLKNLAAQICSQGEIVCKRCDIKELKKYKELISSFFREAVKYSYEFDKQGSFHTSGKYKMYVKIKKINEKIEALTNDFIKEQTEPIEILRKVEDIKGIILDMLL